MLVLSRRVGESIVIGEGVVVKVLAVRGQQIRIGIEAPPAVHIRREELPCLDVPPHAAEDALSDEPLAVGAGCAHATGRYATFARKSR